VKEKLKDKNSMAYFIFNDLKKQLYVRKQHPCFSRGRLEWLSPTSLESLPNKVLAYHRIYKNDHILVIHNLSALEQQIIWPEEQTNIREDLLDKTIPLTKNDELKLSSYSYFWIPI
ncbi:MAG: alpha-glucosidase C-terminal domain-containing protein, partial [Candidatus Hodarchaeota archaeon]